MTPDNQDQPQASAQPPVGSIPQNPVQTVTPTVSGPAAPAPTVSQAPVAPDPTPAPTVTTPSGQPFGVGTPAGYSDIRAAAAAEAQSRPSNKKLLLIGAGIVGVIIVALGTYAFLTFGRHIKESDVTAAQQNVQAIQSDVSDISTAADALNNSPTPDEITSNVKKINSKLTDAEMQYTKIKASPVQKDADAKTKFTDLDKRWTTYAQYVKDNAADMQTIQPIVADLEDKVTKLTSSPVTSVNSYLTSYKKILDDSSSKIANLHMKVTENQQSLDLLKTFLGDASTDVSTAQQILTTNPSNVDGAKAALLKLADSQTSFATSTATIDAAIAKKENSVDPSSQLKAFASQLDTLANKLHS
jgi:hypothetical protein